MNLKKMAGALALAAGLASTAFAAAPAGAAGDTARLHGCAAHWRNTASWAECTAAVGRPLRFHAICSAQADYTGGWKFNLYGHIDPVDRFECTFSVTGAYNEYS